MDSLAQNQLGRIREHGSVWTKAKNQPIIPAMQRHLDFSRRFQGACRNSEAGCISKINRSARDRNQFRFLLNGVCCKYRHKPKTQLGRDTEAAQDNTVGAASQPRFLWRLSRSGGPSPREAPASTSVGGLSGYIIQTSSVDFNAKVIRPVDCARGAIFQ